MLKYSQQNNNMISSISPITQQRSKIWLLGDNHVGKSTMIESLLTNSSIHKRQYDPTLKPNLSVYKHRKQELYILDVPGSNNNELMKIINTAHTNKFDAAGIVIIYDVTDQSTLKNIKPILSIINNYKNKLPSNIKIPIALVASKTDLSNRRIISKDQGQNLSDKLNKKDHMVVKYFETSCKQPNSISEIYDWFADVVGKSNSSSQVLPVMPNPTGD